MPEEKSSTSSEERQEPSETAYDPNEYDTGLYGDEEGDDDDSEANDTSGEGQEENPLGVPPDSQINESLQTQTERVAPSLPDFASAQELEDLAAEAGLPPAFVSKFLSLAMRGSAYQTQADRNADLIIEQELGVNPEYARAMRPRIQAELAQIPDPRARQDRNTVMLAAFQAEIKAGKNTDTFSDVVRRAYTKINGKQATGPASSQPPASPRNDATRPSQRPLAPTTGSSAPRGKRPVEKASESTRQVRVSRSGAVGLLMEKGWLTSDQLAEAQRQASRLYNPHGPGGA